MATFPPEQARVIIYFPSTRATAVFTVAKLLELMEKYPIAVGNIVVLRVSGNNNNAQKWLRAYNHKGGYESWLKNKTNSQQRQKPSK